MNVRMRKSKVISALAVLSLLVFFVPSAKAVIEVDIPDPGLEAAIRDYLDKPTGPIEDIDLRLIVVLLADDMGITDLTGLEYCYRLRDLFLYNNKISNISALSGLTDLNRLWLQSNNISDIQSLVDNPGLGAGDDVWLFNNPLSYEAINTDIPALESRGVEVLFSPRVPRTLLKISGDEKSYWMGFTLPEPFVVQVLDHKGDPFAGVPVTFSVTAGGGSLDAVDATTDAEGLAQATLILGPDPGINTVEVTAAEISTPVTFNATGLVPTVEDVLAFMYTSVEAGTLIGDGPAMSAEKRLNALINMVEEAQRLIGEGLVEEAYEQLADTYSRTDGELPPTDFVAGPTASVLAALIQCLMESM